MTVGDTTSLLPVVDFHPDHPAGPDAQHPSATPVTVHVSVEELPEVIDSGDPEKLRVGATAAAPAQIVLFHGAVGGQDAVAICVASTVPPSFSSKVFAP